MTEAQYKSLKRKIDLLTAVTFSFYGTSFRELAPTLTIVSQAIGSFLLVNWIIEEYKARHED